MIIGSYMSNQDYVGIRLELFKNVFNFIPHIQIIQPVDLNLSHIDKLYKITITLTLFCCSYNYSAVMIE